MKNKFLHLIFFCCSILPSLSSQSTYSSSLAEGLSLIIDKTEKGGMVLKLMNLKNNTLDTICVISSAAQPKAITDLWFDSTFCAFILEAETLLQYRLYSNDKSGWRIVGQEVLVFKDEPQKVGFGGAKLIDGYTLLITNNHLDKSTKRIHLYDSTGNRTILHQVRFDETKYKH